MSIFDLSFGAVRSLGHLLSPLDLGSDLRCVSQGIWFVSELLGLDGGFSIPSSGTSLQSHHFLAISRTCAGGFLALFLGKSYKSVRLIGVLFWTVRAVGLGLFSPPAAFSGAAGAVLGLLWGLPHPALGSCRLQALGLGWKCLWRASSAPQKWRCVLFIPSLQEGCRNWLLI